jgi:hypothetical protein
LIFSLVGVDWDKVSGDLMAGEVLPNVRIRRWGRKPWNGEEDGEDEWASETPNCTGPPIPMTPSSSVFRLNV